MMLMHDLGLEEELVYHIWLGETGVYCMNELLQRLVSSFAHVYAFMNTIHTCAAYFFICRSNRITFELPEYEI